MDGRSTQKSRKNQGQVKSRSTQKVHEKRKKTMITVDRAGFILWTQGQLLVRKADGTFICSDNIKNEEAEVALQKGETIGLLVGGELVSTMAYSKEAGGYKETVWPMQTVRQ